MGRQRGRGREDILEGETGRDGGQLCNVHTYRATHNYSGRNKYSVSAFF
jgi:hypothetical protein